MHVSVLALASRVLQRRVHPPPPARAAAYRRHPPVLTAQWWTRRGNCLTWSLSYWGGSAPARSGLDLHPDAGDR